jgi:hypothetical protein
MKEFTAKSKTGKGEKVKKGRKRKRGFVPELFRLGG